MTADFVMGADVPETVAAVDATLDAAAVAATVARIVEAYRRLVADPAHHTQSAGCVALRRIRSALPDEPRELLDAALRWLDTQPEGQPPSEITFMGAPTPADLAQAVVACTDGEVYLANMVSFDLDGAW